MAENSSKQNTTQAFVKKQKVQQYICALFVNINVLSRNEWA